MPTPAQPHDARAYELYLRGNEAGRTYDGLIQARHLYERCLELDPNFAPAWAQLGRCHRVIGKFVSPLPDSNARAEEAFRKALELNPRLTMAHRYYAQLESEIGQPEGAVLRLLDQAARHGNDPELFAGLVHACRYCGLLEQSVAAHGEARRLDPNIHTSYDETLLIVGDVDRLLRIELGDVVAGADDAIRVIALGFAGRREEARRMLARLRFSHRIQTFQIWADKLQAWLDRDVERMAEVSESLVGLNILEDPEAIFQEGWMLCDLGEHARGLPHLQRAVARGYTVVETLTQRSQFDALRTNPAFRELVDHADAGRQHALAAFREGGGERLLGQ